MPNEIIILDFGSQYTQLIARKVRELKFYAEIHPYNLSYESILEKNPAGIILSGGPYSVYDPKAPVIDKRILDIDIPILGVCYGLQLLTYLFQGKVHAATEREYGKANISIKKADPLLENVTNESVVWMSHGDKIDKLPDSFMTLAKTKNSPYAAIKHRKKPIYGVQFHPEVQHTKNGKKILKNFCHNICSVKANWSMKNFAAQKIQEIKETVGEQRVLLGVSGGVDSMVTAKILNDAIGDQLSCVYVDTGLMRENETKAVIARFKKYFKIKLHVVYSKDIFLNALKSIEDPEQKRKIIGKLFLLEFQKEAENLGYHEYLGQGTLYTDVIESVSVKGPSQTIKSHHNRVREVMDLIKAGKVIEPLNELFKDEVRKLGKELGMPDEILYRHPFPGPGLAIRILGEITEERLNVLRKADAILIEELKNNEQYYKIWQAFAVFLPVKSVGVMGDKRTYENVIALRMVTSEDGMTSDFARVPYEILGKISNRIINEIPQINRVVYDVSSKPPSTIEWE